MEPPPIVRSSIQFPNTCPQNRKHFAHIRLLTQVRPEAWNAAGFEGRLFRCGAPATHEDLGENPVAIECAGPQGTWKRGKHRETLWILWRYDWEEKRWREIARAQSTNWAWAIILREPAIRAMQVSDKSGQLNLAERGREVTEELLRAIDTALVSELPEVRTLVLTTIYDQMAGRIVLA
jgi:hypothetical protein